MPFGSTVISHSKFLPHVWTCSATKKLNHMKLNINCEMAVADLNLGAPAIIP